jgi:acyl-CoA dehydrogenase
MPEQDLLGDSITALFADHATPAAVRRAEKEGLDRSLWKLVTDSGFDKALAPESAGGSGLSLSEVRPVLEACGRYAAPIPLGEAILAHGFAGVCGVTLPDGVVTAAPASVDDEGEHVYATAVPFGANADWVLAVPAGEVAYVFAVSHAKFTPHPGLLAANESDMAWHLAAAHATIKVPAGADWRVAGAALRVCQIAGALDSLLELTTRYSRERTQFGRALAKFQAIQQQIAVLAEDTFAARMASSVACDVLPNENLPFPLGEGPGERVSPRERVLPVASQVAAAKVVASEAASRASNIAHAIHGAMGITEEYDLQLFTRCLLAWRMQYGSEGYWAAQVGNALLSDARKTWEFVRSA